MSTTTARTAPRRRHRTIGPLDITIGNTDPDRRTWFSIGPARYSDGQTVGFSVGGPRRFTAVLWKPAMRRARRAVHMLGTLGRDVRAGETIVGTDLVGQTEGVCARAGQDMARGTIVHVNPNGLALPAGPGGSIRYGDPAH